ncbi:MAG: S9 family peptidase [Candidatus Zixiibacteriota bacterium]|nr:MAG: S9 family peptidase [candidate division Zixibacteria bacterium]
MKFSVNYLKLFLIFILISIFSACSINQTVEIPPPPETKVNTVIDTLHGHAIADDYRWLEEQYSDETRQWIEMQNNYTRSIYDQLPVNTKISDRVTELMEVDYVSTPRYKNGKYFYYKQVANDDLYTIYYKKNFDAPEEILIDPHPMSEDHSVSVEIIDISDDGGILVYGVRKGGDDQLEIRLLDVATKKDLPDILPTDFYYSNVTITNNNKGLFYFKNSTEIGPRIYYHQIGTEYSSDKMIFGKNSKPGEFISVSLSIDGRYLFLSVNPNNGKPMNLVYYKDLTKKTKIKLLTNNIEAHFYPSAVSNIVYLQTDWQAPNWKIMKVDLNSPDVKNWEEVIPVSDLVIRDFTLSDKKLCVTYLDSVKSKISIFSGQGEFVQDITFPTLGNVSSISGNWNNDEAFYSFSSYNLPRTIYRFDHKTSKSEIWFESKQKVNSDDFVVKQVWFDSKDGTKIPMFIAYKKNIQLNGKNPTLMNGYGGFNVNILPRFSITHLTWMENGGIYVDVNLRGGGEFGEAWHKAGKFENKQNTFDDFISAAEWLIKNKYTSSEHLAIRGGSNGGLLVGACLTQRPNLFKAVICTYPLLDMLRYQMFLVGKFWVNEYGSAEKPEQFEYIYEYSPYHHVKPNTNYPAVLFITGDGDTRVDPCHARKMTALLQANNSSNNPIMLRYEIKAGHSGGKPKSEIIKEVVEDLNFLFWQLN